MDKDKRALLFFEELCDISNKENIRNIMSEAEMVFILAKEKDSHLNNIKYKGKSIDPNHGVSDIEVVITNDTEENELKFIDTIITSYEYIDYEEKISVTDRLNFCSGYLFGYEYVDHMIGEEKIDNDVDHYFCGMKFAVAEKKLEQKINVVKR